MYRCEGRLAELQPARAGADDEVVEALLPSASLVCNRDEYP